MGGKNANCLAFAPFSGHPRAKLGRAFGHPRNEFRQPRVAAQSFWGVEIPRQLCLAEGRVDFTMTNVMQQNRWPAFAALEFRDQVMRGLWHAPWNDAHAQWANGVLVLQGLCH